MPSLIARIQNAGRVLLGRDQGQFLPFPQFWNQPGTQGLFKPHEPLEVYGDNTWLYFGVTRIVFQIAETKFKLRNKTQNGDTQ